MFSILYRDSPFLDPYAYRLRLSTCSSCSLKSFLKSKDPCALWEMQMPQKTDASITLKDVHHMSKEIGKQETRSVIAD